MHLHFSSLMRESNICMLTQSSKWMLFLPSLATFWSKALPQNCKSRDSSFLLSSYTLLFGSFCSLINVSGNSWLAGAGKLVTKVQLGLIKSKFQHSSLDVVGCRNKDIILWSQVIQTLADPEPLFLVKRVQADKSLLVSWNKGLSTQQSTHTGVCSHAAYCGDKVFVALFFNCFSAYTGSNWWAWL